MSEPNKTGVGQGRATHRVVNPAGMAPPAANYAHARLTTNASRWLHTSGVVPIDVDGSVPETIADQAAVIWRSIITILAEVDMTPADVVSVTTWVTPGHELGPIMAERDRALGGALAASTLLVVPELARAEWLMEIAVIAAA